MKMRKIDGRSLGYNRDSEIKHRPNKKSTEDDNEKSTCERDIYICVCGYIYIERDRKRKGKIREKEGGIDRG